MNPVVNNIGAGAYEIAELPNILVGAHNLVAKKVMRLSRKTCILTGCCLTLAFAVGFYIAEVREHEARIAALEKQMNDIQEQKM